VVVEVAALRNPRQEIHQLGAMVRANTLEVRGGALLGRRRRGNAERCREEKGGEERVGEAGHA
jgi:hypothetical protein